MNKIDLNKPSGLSEMHAEQKGGGLRMCFDRKNTHKLEFKHVNCMYVSEWAGEEEHERLTERETEGEAVTC